MKQPKGSLGPAGMTLGAPRKGSGPIKGYGGDTAPPYDNKGFQRSPFTKGSFAHTRAQMLQHVAMLRLRDAVPDNKSKGRNFR